MRTPPPVIVVRRDEFKLLFWRFSLKRNHYVATDYPIAVGMAGLKTPGGMYEIDNKSRKPTYTYPPSDWVRELGIEPGTTLKFGDPENPIAERWMGLNAQAEGVGIHGTWTRESIGSAASHGCIRMLPEDVVYLYDQVTKHTPVFIY